MLMGSVVLFPKKRSYGKFQISSEKLEYGSNPTQTAFELSLDAVDDGRKIMCRRQTDCVTFAAAQGWLGFRCDACGISENLSLDEQRDDLDGLAMLLSALDLFYHR